MEKTKERSSNFELLRIVLALLVIIVHYCNGFMGGAEALTEKGSFNYYFINFMHSASMVAVNTFVLITGYFMYDKKEIKLSKPLKLIYLTVVWAILIFIFRLFIKHDLVFNEIAVYKFIQTITDKWFIIIYVILYLFIPYINKIVQSINKKQYIILLSIMFGFFVVWPTLWTNIPVKDCGFGIINFVFLYLIGAFIKIYYDDFNSFGLSFMVYLFSTIFTSIFKLVSAKAFYYNSIFIIIGAVALFETFKAIKMKNSNLINKISSFAITSYIIHENTFINVIIFRELFREADYYTSPYLFLNLIFTTIGIYVFCMIIESIRRLVMKKIDDKIDNIKYKIKV